MEGGLNCLVMFGSVEGVKVLLRVLKVLDNGADP